jgi:undecaprenyl-diphosphatase
VKSVDDDGDVVVWDLGASVLPQPAIIIPVRTAQIKYFVIIHDPFLVKFFFNIPFAGEKMLTQLDYQLFIFLNTFVSCPLFDVIFRKMTDSTTLIAIYLVGSAVHIAFSKKKVLALKRFLIASALLGMLDFVGYNVFRQFFERARPNNIAYFVDGVHIMFPQCHFFGSTSRELVSFPSNHALTNAGVAVLWSLWFPKMAKILIPFAIFICFTRVYVGVHYPFDVFYGFVFGAALAFLVYFGTERWVGGRNEE